MATTRTSLRLASLAVLAAAGTVASAAEPPPLFGDWFYIMPHNLRDPAFESHSDRCAGVWESVIYEDETTYVPVNQPGGDHGGPTYEGGNWLSDYAICVAEQLDAMNAPVSLLIRNRNCPFPYGPGDTFDPLAVEQALDALPKLDYLIMDLEPGHSEGGELLRRNVEEIVRLVRSHPNPRVNKAMIGNYNDWPGSEDAAQIWPQRRNRTAMLIEDAAPWDREAFYHQNLDLAMPIAYPSEIFSRHSDGPIQGENTTPNDRAAIFWGPLERVSIAARNLPEGHMMVPWITNYLAQNGGEQFYHAPPPSEEDLRALLQHYRLRGARSFMIWTPNDGATHHPTIDYHEFRELATESWAELDWVFESAEAFEFLNLETDKKSGLQWSGVRTDSTAYILVSNLHHSHALSADLPAMAGLPDRTPPVQPGEHAVFQYDLEPAARDFDEDGDIDTGDFIAFISAVQTGRGQNLRTVGGKGVSSVDINTSGTIDLGDLIAVAKALRDGRFSNPAAANNRDRTGRRASAPTNPGGRGNK